MKRRLGIALTVSCFLTLGIGVLKAQDTDDIQEGVKAYGSYRGGDVDTVSMTNLSLVLNDPLVSFPQRGKLHLGFEILAPIRPRYIYHTLCVADTCTSYALRDGAAGVHVASDRGYGSEWTSVSETGEPKLTVTWYSIIDPDGASHIIAPLSSATNSPTRTVDATGIYGGTNGIYDEDGTAIGEQGMLEDANGNQLTWSGGSPGTVTDSVGRTINLPPNSGDATSGTGSCPTGSLAVASYANWIVPAPNSGTSTFVFCYAQISIIEEYNITDETEEWETVDVLQSIVLPNGTAWSFQYSSDGYANLTGITLPTGGTISYTWQGSGGCSGVVYTPQALTSRTVNANDGTGPHTWNYYFESPGLKVVDPLGNYTDYTYTTFSSCQAYIASVSYYQGTDQSSNLLKTVTTSYSYSPSPFGPSVGTYAMSIVPTQITTTWADGKTSQITKSYDSGFSFLSPRYPGTTYYTALYGKVTVEKDYDYGSGAPGSVLKEINTCYLWQDTATNSNCSSYNANYANYLSNNMLNSVYSSQITNGSSQAAYTQYGFDETSPTASGLGSSQNLDTSVWTIPYRGNQTSVNRWLNLPTVQTITNKTTFYDTGMPLVATDPLGNPTTYSYSSTFQDAYLTEVTNALNQNIFYNYDYDTGLKTTTTDPNNETTSMTYDKMFRPVGISYPDGGSLTFCYTDTGGSTCSQATSPPYAVVTTDAISSSMNKTTTTSFDGLARVSQTQLNSDPDGVTYTLKTYDADGRVSQTYNPTRCASITSNCKSETTWGYSTNNYDSLSRITSVTEQDGSTTSTNYGSFPCTTVTDEAGRSRESCQDGLGRITSVIEDPGSSPHLNYSTAYTYDALNDLLSVTQNGSNSSLARKRTFGYDSFARLLSAANPESGSINYSYNADNDLVTRIAPSPNQPATGSAQATTTYTYDALNRLTGKSYTDTYSSNPATPSVTFGYDGATLTCPTPNGADGAGAPDNQIGRRSAMCFSAGSNTWIYDPMGRVATENDRYIGLVPPYGPDVITSGFPVPTISTNTNYSYYLNGDLNVVFYPSKIPDYEFYTSESAAGRVITAGDTTYYMLKNATYAPQGALATGLIGWGDGAYNGNAISNTYNDRFQPILLSVNNGSGSVLLNLTYNFNLGSGDNGNVIQIANGKNSSRTQNFLYDSLNRIQQAYTSGTNWGETYSPSATAPGTAPTTPGIDAWGNLTNISGVTGKSASEQLSCAAASTQNQLTSCFTYDAAGNLITNGTTTYLYDDENRLIATSGYSYIYDGDGNRIEKCTQGSTPGTCASNATGTFYWREVGGGTLAESDQGGNWTAAYGLIGGEIASRVDLTGGENVVHYYLQDHLNSTSIVVDNAGNILKESDYYPYGGEIPITNNDTNRYKFTGKERDAESDLDNFGARFYASSFGRFMTPDWEARPTSVPYAKFGDPQTLNLYTYVENAPINRVDADGHCPECRGGGNDGSVESEANGGQQGCASGMGMQCQGATQAANNQSAAGNSGQQAQNSAGAQGTAVAATTAPTSFLAEAGESVGAAFGSLFLAGAAVVASADAAITNITNAYVANKNDEASLAAVESQVAAENAAILKGGPKAADAPGVTAGGQATDRYGHKIGPSGDTQIDRTRSNTREGARNRIDGRAVDHPNPKSGNPHWHPADRNGNKLPSSVHHEYPE